MPLERIPFAQQIETRDGTLDKDSLTTNGVFEGRNQRREFVKRPGLVLATQVTPVTPPNTLLSQGLTSYNGKLISVIDDTIYQTNPSTYVTTTIGSTTTSTSRSYFVKTFLDAYLFFHNKDTGYLYSSGGALSTPSMPSSPYVAGTVFLNNYIFIGTATNNRIYNCDQGDPTTWDVNSYLSFYQAADQLVGITKHLNYLVAFGKNSMQFFYDAGNTTGSPLTLSQSYTLETGCATGDSIATADNTVIWMGTTKSTGRSIYMLEGVSPVKISTNSIDKCLENSNLDKTYAYLYKFAGHTLYILTLHDIELTLVYDLDNKSWYQWTQYALASVGHQGYPGYVESYFRPAYYAEINTIPYCLDDDTANLYYFDVDTYQDNGEDIYYRVVTDLSDNGTTKRKFYGRLEIIGDKVSGGTLQVRHTGNDYNSWSTYRSVNLNSSRSQVYLSGADRRRAWEFLVTSNVPLRLESAEIDFRIGEMDQEQFVGGGR